MIFRHKLLILLLVVGLTPLLINGLLHRNTMQRINKKLTTETKGLLQENAIEQIRSLVHHQSLLLRRDRSFILQSVTSQAREIENVLAKTQQPTEAEFLAAYFSIQQTNPDLFIWQATFLDSGFKAILPKGALTPDQESDLGRKMEQIQNNDNNWQLHFAKASLQITVFSPVYFPNGTLAGITAITLDHQQFFRDWQLPHPWKEQGRLFIVTIDQNTSGRSSTLDVHIEISNEKGMRTGGYNPQQVFDNAVTLDSKQQFIEMVQKNNCGFLALDFNDTDSTWAFSADSTEKPFPLLVIPNTLVTLPANEAVDFVEKQFIDGLKMTILLSAGVLLFVTMIAISRARAVTLPIAALVQAADRLSEGDFTTRVNITSNDEFEELGRAFNQIGPHLRERQEIKKSLAIAKDIQQLILPEIAPSIEHFDLFGRLDYCDETGGDYYDFIRTTTGKWCLLVGDVVGHGVGSALLMASAAGILNSAVVNGEEDLNTLFASLNRFLVKDVGDTRFMTLFCALLDPTERSLQWLSAGHSPVFLYRSESHSVEELPATTCPLGIVANTEVKPVHNEILLNGDILAIGTDGIWETTNSEEEMFGSSQICQMLKELSNETAEEIVSKILLAVENFRGSAPAKDDIALIVLKAN